MEIREAAYVLAERLKIKHPFSHQTRKAGPDWFTNFMKRHGEKISIRKPEATSVGRVKGFNRAQVTQFFDNLEAILAKHNFEPQFIYNIDESGTSKVHTPTKVVGDKKQKQIGRLTAGERGKNITIVCGISAAGSYIPPYFVFPSERKDKIYLSKANLPGVDGKANGSGWMDRETFILYLKHFIKYARPTEENPVLLILDGHNSHTSLEAILLCRDNHITLLTLPPHTSQRMQPCDLVLFGPFKSKLNEKMGTLTRVHLSDIPDVVKLACESFQLVATVDKGISGFRCCGIYPFNRDVFTDDDFAAADNLEPRWCSDDFGSIKNPDEPDLGMDELEVAPLNQLTSK